MRSKAMHFVKRLFVALIAFIVVVCGCIPAQKVDAETKIVVTPLTQNTWSIIKYHNNPDPYLKISVPANGYVKFETKNLNCDIRIYKKAGDSNSGVDSLYEGKKTHYCVLPKGTYYLTTNMHTGAESKVKIRWSFVKASNPSNSCRAKAKKLSGNKKEMIIFNHGYEYSRWYKIVLKKKQPITVNLKCLDNGDSYDDDFDVYKSTGEKVNCPPLVDYTTYRTTILPKGTYYIHIKHDPWYIEKRIMKFSWK